MLSAVAAERAFEAGDIDDRNALLPHLDQLFPGTVSERMKKPMTCSRPPMRSRVRGSIARSAWMKDTDALCEPPAGIAAVLS